MAKMMRAEGGGQFRMEVRGESQYQDALRRAIGRQETPVVVTAEALPEEGNRHDANAVVVRIKGAQVGYIPREWAPGFRQTLRARGYGGVRCPAVIKGGDILGVWLDLPGDFMAAVMMAGDVAPPAKKKRGCGCFGAGAVLAVLAVVGAGVLGCFGVNWD